MKPLKSKLAKAITLATLVASMTAGCAGVPIQVIRGTTTTSFVILPTKVPTPTTIQCDTTNYNPDNNPVLEIINSCIPTFSEDVSTAFANDNMGYLTYDIYEIKTDNFSAVIEHRHGESPFYEKKFAPACIFQLIMHKKGGDMIYKDRKCDLTLERVTLAPGERDSSFRILKEEGKVIMMHQYNQDLKQLENYILGK